MEEKEEKKAPETETPDTEQEPIATPEPQSEGERAEETAAPQPKGRWQELAERFTGEAAASEDEAFDAIQEELADLTEWKRKEMDINKALMDALNAEPDFQELIGYVLSGASFKEAIARTIDIESLTPAEGDPDRAGWEKAKGERLERLKKMEEEDRVNMERTNSIQTNLGNTKALINSFAEKHKMSPEEITTLKEKLAQFTRDILDMKVDEDTLDMILKSIRMEKIIEEAKEDGATDERNRKIEVMRQKREEDTDGLPTLDAGAPAAEPEEKPKGMSDFFGDVFKRRGIQ